MCVYGLSVLIIENLDDLLYDVLHEVLEVSHACTVSFQAFGRNSPQQWVTWMIKTLKKLLSF